MSGTPQRPLSFEAYPEPGPDALRRHPLRGRRRRRGGRRSRNPTSTGSTSGWRGPTHYERPRRAGARRAGTGSRAASGSGTPRSPPTTPSSCGFTTRRAARPGQRRKVELFDRAAPHLSPAGERVEIAFEGATIPGYLRLPAAAGDGPFPCCVLIGGLESTKEESHLFENLCLERGIATFAFDGPGQGEMFFEVKLGPDFERYSSAVLDHLVERRPRSTPGGSASSAAASAATTRRSRPRRTTASRPASPGARASTSPTSTRCRRSTRAGLRLRDRNRGSESAPTSTCAASLDLAPVADRISLPHPAAARRATT